MKYTIEDKNKADIIAYVLGYMPENKVGDFELKLKNDSELFEEYEIHKNLIILGESQKKDRIRKVKLERWRKEKKGKAEPSSKIIPFYTTSIFRYAASVFLFSLGIGYWISQAPQRAADDVLTLVDSRGVETGCLAHFEKVLKEYEQNRDAVKAIQILKSESYSEISCTSLSKFYEAALSVKAKKYDEAEILLNQVIRETENDSPVKNEAKKLLDTL